MNTRILTPELLRQHFRPHQRRIIGIQARSPYSPGVLLAHQLGSGKTRTMIGLIERWRAVDHIPIQAKVLVLTKKTILRNVFEEADKMRAFMDVPTALYTSATYESYVAHPERYTFDVLAIDEAHFVSNPKSQRYPVIFEAAEKARKIILMTGTPINNYTREWASLINLILASPGRPYPSKYWTESELKGTSGCQAYLPMTAGVWKAKYGKDGDQNVWHLRRYARLFVSVYREDKTSDEYKSHFPTVVYKDIDLDMTEDHYRAYCSIERAKRPDGIFGHKTPLKAEAEIWEGMMQRRRLHQAKQGDVRYLAYIMHLRMACNSVTLASDTTDKQVVLAPKLKLVAARVVSMYRQLPHYKAVIYSNFLECGVQYMARALRNHGIPFGMIVGDSTIREIEQCKQHYNSGSTRVLLISSAGGQGLDLHATNEFFEIEPHWNVYKNEQAECRVVRYDSHRDTPHKIVKIYKLHVKIPSYKEDDKKSADTYLKEFALTKNEAVEAFYKMLSKNCLEVMNDNAQPINMMLKGFRIDRKRPRTEVLKPRKKVKRSLMKQKK